MNPDFNQRLRDALKTARRELLDERNSEGHWTGELSSSALSTATAVCALTLVDRFSNTNAPRFEPLVDGGLKWLAENVNVDGGWGDTDKSLSNISTTALCWAAFGVVEGADAKHQLVVRGAGDWLQQRAGGPGPDRLARAIISRYGKDRTFSVPILTMCALAGRLGQGSGAWKHVIPLPFELAAFPHSWFAALRLPVVSYALPALIAIGQARHFHRPTRNPVTRILRNVLREKTLRKLESIQPSSGGFLEATPLTSFVTMSLAASGNVNHPVTRLAAGFLERAVRPDGSWPIDTNLATWVTTLSVNALANDSSFEWNPEERTAVCDWLLGQQYRTVYPYTNAAPGGWAWTDLPGGVPDADDTPGALLALKNLGQTDDDVHGAAAAGVTWLLDLQNRDGGIPTFCRGWGKLGFDQSSPDLTAHTIRAWLAWRDDLPGKLRKRIDVALPKAKRFLESARQSDGSWIPLWFGNQFQPEDANEVYGTSRVLLSQSNRESICWLLENQNADGGWGNAGVRQSTIEETALALEALACHLKQAFDDADFQAEVSRVIRTGTEWLITRIEDGSWKTPSPIGFYFAKLWYYEKLYPMIFSVGALGSVVSTHKNRKTTGE